MLEKDVELLFVRLVKSKGYMVFKFLSTSRGVPDRIVFGGRHVYLVEFKNGNRGRLSELQKITFKRFKDNGFPVTILRTKDEVRRFVDNLPSLLVSADRDTMDTRS